MNNLHGRNLRVTFPDCLVCTSKGSVEFWATAKDVEYLTSEDRFSFYRCKECNVLFIDPVPGDRLNEIYPSNYYSFIIPKKSLVNTIKGLLDRKTFQDILKTIPGRELSILDIGGGSGWELNVVRQADSRVTFSQVVDFDPAAAELAKQNGHEYFQGRIEDFRPERKFDFILMLNLIEHVENPANVLRSAAAMLSPDGCILIKTPNFESLDARIFRHTNWGGYHCPRHWVIFTKESLASVAMKSGLHVTHLDYTQGAPFWTVSMLYWLQKRNMISITRERPAMYHPLFPLLAAGFASFDLLRKPFAKTSQMFAVLKHA